MREAPVTPVVHSEETKASQEKAEVRESRMRGLVLCTAFTLATPVNGFIESICHFVGCRNSGLPSL